MPRRIVLVVVGAILAAVATSPPAQAANQDVILGHDEYLPKRVAVKPGETVNWTNPDDHEEHNVHFDDESYRNPVPPTIGPWTISRTFGQTTGAFAYHCDIHGNYGGVGMSGTVYVNATGSLPPIARANTTPAVAVVGQTVTFSATTSTADQGQGRQIVKYEWDLNGDGIFETDTGSTPTATRNYASPSLVDVKLRVTDDVNLTDVTTLPLRVTAAPTASFSASPSQVKTGQTVTFDASTSVDPDGTIARHEWDLDGNGVFETDTAGTPTVSRAFTTAGTRTIGLRVTDEHGVSTTTTRQVVVTSATSAPPPTQPAAPTPATVACSSLTGTRRATCMQKACASVSRSRRSACYQRSCRYLPSSKRAACVRKSCRWTSRSKRKACMKKSCRYLKGSKKRACVRKYSRRR